jgi:hypothetical protein
MNLEQLKKAADDARAAYYSYKPDGTVAGDIEEKRLAGAAWESGAAYQEALDAFIAAQPMRWPSDFTNKHGEYGDGN